MFFSGKFVLDLATFAQQQGVAPSTIFQASGRQPKTLEAVDVLVDYDAIASIFKVIQQQLKNPHFGLHMGELIDLKATQYVDQLMDHCATVQEAFEQAIAYSQLISDSMQCSLELIGDHFKVNFELNPDWALVDDYTIQQNLDMALICAKNSLSRLTQQTHFPHEVNFYYPKPKKTSEYFRLFNCHLRFNQPISSIVFHKHLLHQPTSQADYGLLEVLKVAADQMMAALPQQHQLLTQVKKALLKNITPASFHIDHVAQELGTTPRTLQRKLKAEQLTFKQIQQDVRRQLVRKIMDRGYQDLEEIAYLVGYSEASALVRAFKGWTGQTPKQYLYTKQKASEADTV